MSSRAATFQYQGKTPRLTQVVSTSPVSGKISYDPSGNEAQVGQNTYTYSARNELIQAQGPQYTAITLPNPGGHLQQPVTIGAPWTYKYDGSGQRLATTITELQAPSLGNLSPTKQVTRYSLPDPGQHVLTETSITNSGYPAYDYVWLGDKPIAQLDAAGAHYDFTDHLGVLTVQTGGAGIITYQGDYEPYGTIYDLRGADAHQPLRFPGQVAEQFDSSANGATDVNRWYRREWGRYSQADPLGLEAGINEFAYASEKPMSLVDPSGLEEGTPGGDLNEAYDDIKDVGLADSFTASGLRNTANSDYAEFAHELYPDPKDHKLFEKTMQVGGRAKAFHHCEWSCLMAQKIGVWAAYLVGYNHEVSGFRKHEANDSRLMDMANNHIGRRIGACATADCKKECKKKALDRTLRGENGRPLQHGTP